MRVDATKPLVLVVEDEPQIRRFLRATLAAHGLEVAEAETGKAGMLAAATQPPDLMILDLGLPDMDGLDVTRQLRTWTRVPIIVLSARGQESDKVAALDAGADDYVTKPFSVGELAARCRVALRHAAAQGPAGPEPVFEHAGLRVDLARRTVSVRGREVKLTPTEYRLLALLVQHSGKVVTHRQLLKEVWGPPYADQTQYLRVYMGQLRRKIEADAAQPRHLLTEQGVGYRLAAG